MTRRLNLYIGAASLVVCALVVAGCGSSNYTPPGPSNRVSGTTSQAAGTAPSVTVPATGGATTTVTVGGNPVNATVPSGAPDATSGQHVAVVKIGSTPLSGTFSGPLGVTVNGVTDSGVMVDANGALLENVALPIDPVQGTVYSFVFPGGSVHTRSLTVGSWTMTGRFYYVGGAVISPVPTALTGIIPNNGDDPTGSWVQATFGPGNAGRSATLTIYYSSDHVNGTSITKTVAIDNANVADFKKLTSGGGSIPSSGVDSIVLEIGDLI